MSHNGIFTLGEGSNKFLPTSGPKTPIPSSWHWAGFEEYRATLEWACIFTISHRPPTYQLLQRHTLKQGVPFKMGAHPFM